MQRKGNWRKQSQVEATGGTRRPETREARKLLQIRVSSSQAAAHCSCGILGILGLKPRWVHTTERGLSSIYRMQIEVLDQERADHLYVKPSNNWMLKSSFSRLHLPWVFVIVLSCRASCSAMLAFLLGDYHVGGELTIFISVWLSDFHIVMLIIQLTCWLKH